MKPTVPKSAYMVGIKGVGMTAIAVYLKEAGWVVEGSDVSDTFPTDAILKKFKIPIKKGFSPDNVNKKYDVVIVTGAHGGMKNSEAVKAAQIGIKTVMHGRYLGELMEGKSGISVSGCHGKTTTAAMIASILSGAGLDPSYAVGTASINNLGASGHFGFGIFFVAEADEYMTCPETDKTPRFMWQNPNLIVITNIEYDHPDAFDSIFEVKTSFSNFVDKLPKDGTLVACIDNKNVAEILSHKSRPHISYGFSPRADFCITRHYSGGERSFFRVNHKNIDVGEFVIKVPGTHNMLNSLGAALAAHTAGVGFNEIKKCLKNFTGTKRRFEQIAKVSGVDLYDDYAHHPSEIAATLRAAKTWFPRRRVIVLFQPHTYSRTKSLLSQFARCFKDADIALVTDIYPSAREAFDDSISSKILVSQINQYHKNASFVSRLSDILKFLLLIVKDDDVVMTMGAGDIYLWHKKIIDTIKSRYIRT